MQLFVRFLLSAFAFITCTFAAPSQGPTLVQSLNSRFNVTDLKSDSTANKLTVANPVILGIPAGANVLLQASVNSNNFQVISVSGLQGFQAGEVVLFEGSGHNTGLPAVEGPTSLDPNTSDYDLTISFVFAVGTTNAPRFSSTVSLEQVLASDPAIFFTYVADNSGINSNDATLTVVVIPT